MAKRHRRAGRTAGGEKITVRVYDDLASPAARSIGDTLNAAVRTALRPIDGVIWSVDKSFDWLAQRVTARLRSLGKTEVDIGRPPVQIEAHVVRALQLVGPYEDPLLRNFFACLIAEAMMRNGAAVRPSMVAALRDLYPEEAKLIAVLAAGGNTGIISCEVEISWTWRCDGEEVFYPPADRVVFQDARSGLDVVLGVDATEVGRMVKSLHQLEIVSGVYSEGRYDVKYNLPRVTPYPCSATLWDEWQQRFEDLERNGPPVRGHFPALRSEVKYAAVSLTEWGAQLATLCGAGGFFNPLSCEFTIPDWAA